MAQPQQAKFNAVREGGGSGDSGKSLRFKGSTILSKDSLIISLMTRLILCWFKPLLSGKKIGLQ